MAKISYLRYQKCCACKVSLQNKNYNRHVQRVSIVTVSKCKIFFEDNNIQVGDYIFYKCRTKLNKRNSVLSTIAYENTEDSILEYSSSEEERISNHRSVVSSGKKIELWQAHSGYKHCLLCKKKTGLHPKHLFLL